MLLLLSGLPGSGKSTIAREYVARYGGVHISSDLIRTELGLRGHYQPGDKARVYTAMLERTTEVLSNGGTAVVDGTFYSEATRTPFEAAARACGVPVFRVQVRAQETTVRQRLQKSRPDSEADFAVYEKIRDQYEPWLQPHLELWSDSESVTVLATILYQHTLSDHDR